MFSKECVLRMHPTFSLVMHGLGHTDANDERRENVVAKGEIDLIFEMPQIFSPDVFIIVSCRVILRSKCFITYLSTNTNQF